MPAKYQLTNKNVNNVIKVLKHFPSIKYQASTLKRVVFTGILSLLGVSISFVLLGYLKLALFLLLLNIPLLVFNFYLTDVFNSPQNYLINLTPSKIKTSNILDFMDTVGLEFLYLVLVKPSKLPYNRSYKGIVTQLGVDPTTSTQITAHLSQTPKTSKHLKSILEHALQIGIKTQSLRIKPEHIFYGIYKTYPQIRKILKNNTSIIPQDLVGLIRKDAIFELVKARYNPYDFLTPYIPPRGIAYAWFSGFTFYISHISTDIIEFLKYHPGLYGLAHKDILKKLIEILPRPSNPNAFLIGAPGTGKTSIIYGLAQKILLGEVPTKLRKYNIYAINVNRLLSAITEFGGLAKFMTLLENELKQNPNVIFFIDDFEILLSSSINQEILIQTTALFTKYNIPVVATLTPAAYSKIQRDLPTIANSFETLEVHEPSEEETYDILLSQIPQLSQRLGIIITIPSIRAIIQLAKRYLPHKKFPKKAVMLLEKAAAKAAKSPHKLVTVSTVRKVIEEITGIKTDIGQTKLAKRLLELEDLIHKEYINQEEAVRDLVNALKRARLELNTQERPIGVFLFLGPTGVGKTYLAKIAAKYLFENNHQIIRVDLSQFKLPTDIPTILKILEKVRLRPYSLVLLDEFEKAHPQIHDIFLRMFDEGVITDSNGEDLYFTNSLIVATSNIGSREILKLANNYEKAKQVVLDLLFKYLKPELINRFDSILVFKPLSKEHLKQIANLQLQKLAKQLAQQGIKLKYSQNLIAQIVEASYQPELGARPLRRYIDKVIKTQIAQKILEYKLKYGREPKIIDLG